MYLYIKIHLLSCIMISRVSSNQATRFFTLLAWQANKSATVPSPDHMPYLHSSKPLKHQFQPIYQVAYCRLIWMFLLNCSLSLSLSSLPIQLFEGLPPMLIGLLFPPLTLQSHLLTLNLAVFWTKLRWQSLFHPVSQCQMLSDL